MGKKVRGEELGVGERVVAAVAMPQIPEGVTGKVTFVAGFSWIRYWVRFDNGVTRGSLHRRKLARRDEWVALLDRRARGEDEPGPARMVAAVEVVASANGDADSAGGVPAHLLERSTRRREVLGKPR